MDKFHVWGDTDFDWAALNEAANYIQDRCRQFGRFGVWTKEKYGMLRISTTCAYWGEWPIHNLFKPGHVCYRWPRWMYRIDLLLGNAVRWSRITRLTARYQTAVLKFFWLRAAKKWPHIATEILDEYNWSFPDEAA